MNFDNFTWSFSSLSSYRTCPRGWYLRHVEGIEGEGNFFSDSGLACHRCLEDWAKGNCPQIMLAEAFEDEWNRNVTHNPPPYQPFLKEKTYNQLLTFFSQFEGFGEGKEILSVERPFVIKVPGNHGNYLVKGIADIVIADRRTHIPIVLDYKTKSKVAMKKDMELYTHQLYIYAMWCKEEFGVYPERMGFYLLKDPEGDYSVAFTEDGLNKTIEWIEETVDAIKADTDWVPHQSQYFCDNICPVGTACEFSRRTAIGGAEEV